MVGEVNPFLGKLKETAGQNVTDADKASVRDVMVAKAVLKFSRELKADPSVSNQATQDKITKGLELQGLTPAEKVAVAQRALDLIEGKNKPTIFGGFNTAAGGTTPSASGKDHVAELNALQVRMGATHINDAERRAEALKSARAFIMGKEGEVNAIIVKQTPEIQRQAQQIMSKIDSTNVDGAVGGIVHDVVEQARKDISSGKIKVLPGTDISLDPTPEDIKLVKATAKGLIAERMQQATSPSEIQRVLDNIDMGEIYRTAANKGLARFESAFGKIPTADEALGLAAQGVNAASAQIQQSYADRDAARAELERLKVTNPDQYKAKCEAMTPEQAPILAGVCVDAFKAPKR